MYLDLYCGCNLVQFTSVSFSHKTSHYFKSEIKVKDNLSEINVCEVSGSCRKPEARIFLQSITENCKSLGTNCLGVLWKPAVRHKPPIFRIGKNNLLYDVM